jgi:hypothetical protein
MLLVHFSWPSLISVQNIVPILAIVEAGLSQAQNPVAGRYQQRIHIGRMTMPASMNLPTGMKSHTMEDRAHEVPEMNGEKDCEFFEADIKSVNNAILV